MQGLGLVYAGIRIGICWDWNFDMIGLGLGFAGIKIGICWDWD
jgi:hypothetical protein